MPFGRKRDSLPDTACPECGADTPSSASFCTGCGADLRREPDAIGPLAATPGRTTRDALGMDQLRHETLGEYEILGELGRGGMATVYLAHDIALDRRVAVKVISPYLLTDENAERFKREARTAAGLSHPHVIPIYAVRETESLLFFVMKYVAGPSVEMLIRDNGPLPVPVVQAVITQAGEALDYAHRNDIVHRDIKPGNIMVDEEGWVVVTDFGIAKALAQTGLTTTGTTVGTPSHMSPEQCLGHPVTGASDQYSLGVVAYEMLSGSVPFSEDTPMAMMYAHINQPPAPLREIRSDCPTPLAETITRMLAKDAKDRFPTMEDVIKAMGAPPGEPNAPVRRTMISLAQRGAAGRRTSLPSTPRSPIPPTATPPDRAAPAPLAPRAARVPWLRWTIPLVAGAAVLALAVTLLSRPPAAVLEPPTQAPLETIDTPEDADIDATREVRAAPPPVDSAAAPLAPDPRPQEPRRPVEEARVGQPQPQPGPVPIAIVEVMPGSGRLAVGETLRLRAVLRDSAGRALDERPVRWTSGDPRVATVSDEGVVLGVGPGVVQVSAASEDRNGGAVVSVIGPAPAPAPTEQAAPADPRPAVMALLERYSRAVGARSVAGIEATFPALPASTRRTWQDLFDAYEEITAGVVPGTVNISESGESATFDLALTLRNRGETQEVVLRSQAELRREGREWRFARIEQSFAPRE